MSYSMSSRPLCKTHPDVDYKHAWGCPECVRELRERNAKLTAACELVLLFYTAGTWEYEERAAWANGMATCFALSEPPTEATTKNLCNAVRAALGRTT